jgi:hypothetical protein
MPNTTQEAETAFQEKRPGMTNKKVLFHHDNASVYSNAVAQKKTELRLELLAHNRIHLIWLPRTFISSQN